MPERVIKAMQYALKQHCASSILLHFTRKLKLKILIVYEHCSLTLTEQNKLLFDLSKKLLTLKDFL